jgi:hypothetical protein
MTEDLGFRFNTNKRGEVLISHHGKLATTLRGLAAEEFLLEAESASEIDLQQTMARLTGNYKHGNERRARNHPRNR